VNDTNFNGDGTDDLS
jgi:hypothetical protein